MSDLIDRLAAIDAVGDVHPLDYNAMAVVERLRNLPSAQPESRREWYMKGYRDAQPRWIPVTERLPEDGVAVLTTTENAEIHIDYVITDGFGERYFLNNTAYDDFDVTAWMPLPEPYKGGADMRGTDNDA